MSLNGDNDNGGDKSGSKPSLFERLRALFGLGGASIRDDVQEALGDISAAPGFSPLERAMLKNVLSLHEVSVADIMIPRADILSVAYDATLAEVLEVFHTAGHSRLPVHGENLDDPRGMIHIRDFVDFIAAATDNFKLDPALPSKVGFAEMSLAESGILRPVLFVPPSMPALDLLVKMQTSHTHMALVIDEYGGTDGLASIEDIVEMIVGDIEDEHDANESPKIERAEDGTFIVDARASLGDVSQVLGEDLGNLVDAEEIDTVGGLITSLAGHVPVRGEILSEAGLEFEVLDADPRRVKRVRIRRAAVSDDGNAGEAGKGEEHGAPEHAPSRGERALATRGKSR
jgi:CBS domain containing-hemolysin-like protein